MRAALWLLGLFGVAVAIALFAGNNQGTITVFWPPYRVDLSLNLVLLLLVALFVTIHLALRALGALLSLPREARRWRAQQKERAMHLSLLDALSHLLAGRFVRAQKSAEAALRQEQALEESAEAPPHAVQLRALSHLLLAESAQSLQNRPLRDAHLKQALEPQREQPAVREGAQLRAARWALDDRDADAALRWLDELPQGAGRRTLALRLRLKAARQARQTTQALDTARLLAKHRAFSAGAAQSIVRGLALELIHAAHDPAQVQRAWSELEAAERQMPEVAIQAAQRLQRLGGEVALARQWLLPAWEEMLEAGNAGGGWPESQRVRLIDVLEAGFGAEEAAADHAWLTRIESAQLARPRDAGLQYLAGMVCLHHQLWGKAQLLLAQAAQSLQDAGQTRKAWRALAQLAEQREDAAAAANAWKQAAGLR